MHVSFHINLPQANCVNAMESVKVQIFFRYVILKLQKKPKVLPLTEASISRAQMCKEVNDI